MNKLLNQLEYFLKPKRALQRLSFDDKDHQTKKITLFKKYVIEESTNEVVARLLLKHGIYDLAVSEALFKLVTFYQKGPFVDIGANIGYTTILMSIFSKDTEVHTFEPFPITIDKLQNNLKLNNLKPNLYKIGLSDEPATLKMALNSIGHLGEAFIVDNDTDISPETKVFEIKTDKLDNIFKDAKSIPLVKLDIEGHEYSALKGSENLLSNNVIKNIVFEEHHNYPYKTYKLLEDKGYEIYRLGKSFSGLKLIPLSDYKSYSLNWEPNNYLATCQPNEVKPLFASKGYDITKYYS